MTDSQPEGQKHPASHVAVIATLQPTSRKPNIWPTTKRIHNLLGYETLQAAASAVHVNAGRRMSGSQGPLLSWAKLKV